MKEFNQNDFIDALQRKFPSGQKCSACNGMQFIVGKEYATIYLGKSFDSITLGPNIPAGVLVCSQCGHIELFSLGIMGLMPKGEKDDKKTNG